MRALLVALLVALVAGVAGAKDSDVHPTGPLSAQQCAGIATRVPDDTKRAIVGAIDQPGRAAAFSNLDIVVYQLGQLPQYTGRAIETVQCVAGVFLASTSERDPRWKMARGNLRAWLAARAGGADGAAGTR